MEIVRGLESLPLPVAPSVTTVGFFDGVHVGHQAVFATTVEGALEREARSVAVTFDRHPREVLAPGTEPRLLTTVERKASLIRATGIDVLVVLPFTPEFSRVTAEEFVRGVLVEGLGSEHAVMGANFTFGYKATGTVATLPGLGAPFGLTAEGVPLLELAGEPGRPQDPHEQRIVSSSSIRAALVAGDLRWPHRALGRRFVLDGEVVSGHGRGKGLGYPTANLRTWPRLLLPGQGIYAGVADVHGRPLPRGDRRRHQPHVRYRATPRRGIPAGLRGGGLPWRTRLDRVLGAPARRGALRQRRRIGRGHR